MIPTWFLSMWISNTATTAMMIAIVQAVINQLKSDDLNQQEMGDMTHTNGDAVLENGVTNGNAVKEKGEILTTALFWNSSNV